SGETVDEESVIQVWRAKYLYESRYNPHTDKPAFLLGRPSSCVILNAVIGAAVVTYTRQLTPRAYSSLLP
ncbi:hypothetical protein L9F63_008823, partial [Diploptera punctata]